MLLNGGKRRSQIVALQTMSPRDSPDDRSQRGIMGVRDIRKQMMFDLVIETAGEPGRQAG